ncbi:hypothetical protein FQN54_002138 [Arachnomyces sp. PD_36]|nr:hypothetical protein FQN54_002138 [Arachnomyces sp. PD_36]
MSFPTLSAFKLLRDKLYHPKPEPLLEGSPAAILLLPVDVVRYIVDNIPPPEAAALALSSKAILNTVGRQVLIIESVEDRVEFLKHLEIFYPKHVLCYQCGKFHQCQRNAVMHVTPCDAKNGWFISDADHSIRADRVPFTIFQGIMNRHRYGGKHGIPRVPLLHPLFSRSTRWYKPYRLWAKIVDNELILKRDLFTPFGREPYFYCPHLKLDDIERYYEYRSWSSTEPVLVQCIFCGTEIRLDFFTSNGEPWRSRVRVWYNLGHCRSPFDDKWQALTQLREFREPSAMTISPSEARYIDLF